MLEAEVNTSEETTENLEVTEAEQPGQVEQTEQQQIVDLDSVDKFKFAGKEWTPKDFQGAYMMQSDYTKKTQALAEERKYFDNLTADLESVKSNPSLIEKFKSVYPEKFHKFLGYVQGASQPQAQKQTENAQSQIDPAFKERFERLESEIHERKVQAIEAELDAKFKGLSEKYPMADEEAVLARAQALIDRGEKLNDKIWDGLWKSVNERNQKLAEQFYAKKIKEQKTTNQKGKDIASGGGTPGQAPKVARSIKEATQMLMDSETL